MTKRRRPFSEETGLKETVTIPVRFSEVDSLGIVWHGHYILYFEQGREAFGKAHHIDYLTVKAAGFTTPIVQSTCEHKLPLRYGDDARIETTYVDTPAAKLIFRFKIYNGADQLVCQGETIQVFLDSENNLVLGLPEFVLDWKRKVGLL
ncbi:acyl-CoA thioesterase [Sphingobacterium griseoflavum]|uniref:4-hydroxybenzoyl-CoA thioesterase n=1 Tax=Sphingobacterium griseoflavum TaxID=1474952 RepID=A0ABQ3HW56_9SPHI|nr:acyl-CoA thioesterase [Sphingobacterium griseoflavum]GHE40617.1 4-hydroxybenzoyl-CoA thioesterase [Sphingobacterium griseoflavum]